MAQRVGRCRSKRITSSIAYFQLRFQGHWIFDSPAGIKQQSRYCKCCSCWQELWGILYLMATPYPTRESVEDIYSRSRKDDAMGLLPTVQFIFPYWSGHGRLFLRPACIPSFFSYQGRLHFAHSTSRDFETVLGVEQLHDSHNHPLARSILADLSSAITTLNAHF